MDDKERKKLQLMDELVGILPPFTICGENHIHMTMALVLELVMKDAEILPESDVDCFLEAFVEARDAITAEYNELIEKLLAFKAKHKDGIERKTRAGKGHRVRKKGAPSPDTQVH